jgi:hypothetical protein
MAVGLYMDVHVPEAITEELRRRGVDVATAIDDGFGDRPDPEVLERAHALGRVLFTQDIRFFALAQQWQREGRRKGPGAPGMDGKVNGISRHSRDAKKQARP